MAKLLMLKQQTKTLTTASDEYKKNVIKVCLYVSAVVNSSLPTLTYTIPDWDAFSAAYTKAKSDALVWTNTVLASLLATPRSIMQVNQAIQDGLNDAIADAAFLVQHPTDKTTQELLAARLTQMLNAITLTKTQISDVLSKLKDFSEDLPKQAENLQGIADTAKQGAEVDQQKVADLQADIADLQAEIDSLTAQIVGLGIADAACITLGALAIAVAGPWGLITWPFLGIGLAVATTYIVLDGMKIASDQQQIEQDQAEINAYTQDVALLEAFANTYNELSAQALAIQDNVQAIIDAWTVCENDVNEVINDLNDAEKEFDSQAWATLESDLQAALAEWEQMITDVGPLVITIDASDADIKAGMSGDQVQAAVDQAGTMGFIEYLNKVA